MPMGMARPTRRISVSSFPAPWLMTAVQSVLPMQMAMAYRIRPTLARISLDPGLVMDVRPIPIVTGFPMTMTLVTLSPGR